MISKISWGVALILVGVAMMGIAFPYLSVITGIVLIIAGISHIADI